MERKSIGTGRVPHLIEPPLDIVEAVFGLRAFEKPETSGLSGALVEFRGISFLTWFDPEKLASFTTQDGAYFGPGGEEPLYHPKRMDFRIAGRLSHSLKFA